ncbi:MAG TPA: PAS domain S-box protein [Candidatus Krumholzibacteria bacterium]|nr:PAS domain S-box protein [Candidatus Krumholzibacteria bacterium]
MRIRATPGRVAAVYAAFSLAWILVFDLLVESRIEALRTRTVLDALWGVIYMVLTTVVIYVLVARISRHDESERAWYGELFAASPDAIFILDPDGRITDANHVACERYGWDLAGLRAMRLADLAPARLRAAHDQRFAAALAGSGRYETRHETAAGRRLAVDVALRPVQRGREPRLLCTVRDITGLQTAIETLRQSEEMQRALVTCSPVALYAVGLDGRVLSWNRTAEVLTGWSADETIGRALPIVPPEEAEHFAARRRLVMGGQTVRGVHVSGRHRDGTPFTGSLSVAPVRAADGGIMGMMCALEDITDRLNAEAALADSERRFRRAVEEAPFPMMIHASDGEILARSRAVADLTGYGPGEVATMADWIRLAHGGTPFEPASTTGADERVVVCRDGARRHWQFSSTPLGNLPDGRGLAILMAADVTGRKQAEVDREAMRDQLYHAQRMEAVGELAGGVAHDFNNILQALGGYARLLLDTVAADGLLREGLEEIQLGADRALALTRQLLAFSRRQVMQSEDLDLDGIVEGMLRMVRNLAGERNAVRFEPGGHLPCVRADRSMLEQVILNLCVNARDALADQGGTITLATSDFVPDAAFREANRWAAAGRYVVLEVTDDGCGMDAATLARVFEPFFTTKQRNRGTGLGLSTVYGIVQQHEGMVVAASRPGRGSVFRVYLPAAGAASAGGEAVEPRFADTAEPLPVTGRGELVLVAEDDSGARRLATRVLELGGYMVLTAADGHEAVELFCAHADEVALVVLDVVMPGLGGLAVRDRVRDLRPALPVLFVTGRYGPDGGDPGDLGPGVALLPKPYAPVSLIHTVRACLDRTDPARIT